MAAAAAARAPRDPGALYGLSLQTEADMEAFYAERREPVEHVRTSEDTVVAKVGRDLYEKFFRGYTASSGSATRPSCTRPCAAASRCAPTRTTATSPTGTRPCPWTATPRCSSGSSTTPTSSVAEHALEEIRDEVDYGHLVYTGPIDGFFGYRFGRLPYRSLEWELELAGEYDRWELNRRLERGCGDHASVWEEAYGYAGLELLAKGIPVVANGIGGMVDYLREGETGRLNDSCTAEGMAAVLARLIEDPSEVAERSRSTLAAREALIKPFEAHVDEIEAIYREVGMTA